MSTPNLFVPPSDLSAGGPAPSATLAGSLTVQNLTFQTGGVMTVTGDAVLTAENIVLQGAANGPQIVIAGACGEIARHGQRGFEGRSGVGGASGTCRSRVAIRNPSA